jgi:hypothetical protein
MNDDDFDLADADSDAALLERLRTYAQSVDGPTDLYLALARASFEFRDLDAALAELVEDSSWQLAASSNTIRSTMVPRLSVFDLGEGARLELEFLSDRLVGEVSGGELQAAGWRAADAQHAAEVVEPNFFECARLPTVPFYIEVQIDGRRVATEWILHR